MAYSHYSSVEEDNADLAYEDLYLKALNDSESEIDTSPAHVNSVTRKTDEESEDSLSNIQESSPSAEAHCQLTRSSVSLLESISKLGGSLKPGEDDSTKPSVNLKAPLKTCRERRSLIKDSQHVASFLIKSGLTSWAPNSLIKLRRLMSRPAGCTFLGFSATTTKVWLGEYGKNQQTLVADLGSDITLISQKALSEMNNPPKLKTGEKINLIQVTSTSKISGFVTIPIY